MTVEQTSDETRRIDLGAEVVAFLQSPVGVALTKRAEEEEREALEELAVCDPDDPKVIRDLQNRVHRANSIIGWLQEVIGDAVAAHKVLEEQERVPESTV